MVISKYNVMLDNKIELEFRFICCGNIKYKPKKTRYLVGETRPLKLNLFWLKYERITNTSSHNCVILYRTCRRQWRMKRTSCFGKTRKAIFPWNNIHVDYR